MLFSVHSTDFETESASRSLPPRLITHIPLDSGEPPSRPCYTHTYCTHHVSDSFKLQCFRSSVLQVPTDPRIVGDLRTQGQGCFLSF